MSDTTNYSNFLEPVYRVHRDLVAMIKQGGKGGITDTEVRFLVDLYYTIQKQRVATSNRIAGLIRDAKKAGTEYEPHDAFRYIFDQTETVENQIKRLMAAYVASHEMAWFFDQTLGVGPVLSAGLLAHIDIHKAPTAGHIWRFAGLDPTQEWKKGERRPHNGQLKTLCWKIGDSFVKLSSRPDALYGRIYKDRKVYEWQRNIRGGNVETAGAILAKPAKRQNTDTDRAAWLGGKCSADKARAMLEENKTPTAAACKSDDGLPMLPPAQIDARARRYTVKLFLSHLQQRWWETSTGEAPPKPFAISIQGHAHYIEPPQQRLQPKEAA